MWRTCSAGQLTAVDINSGQLKWQTKPDKKIVYSEFYSAGDKLVVKRGGSFADAKGKPQVYAYGLDVLDKATGQPTFDSMTLHKPKDRQIADMTNVLVEGNMAYCATQKSLRAFDLLQVPGGAGRGPRQPRRGQVGLLLWRRQDLRADETDHQGF
ncbi:MAG: hypothetical protein EXS58_06940 [Candidatus Latescibacteria bacterium]|nr:hypothetical protein [Candidatus Latescibacterota bacterium]